MCGLHIQHASQIGVLLFKKKDTICSWSVSTSQSIMVFAHPWCLKLIDPHMVQHSVCVYIEERLFFT